MISISLNNDKIALDDHTFLQTALDAWGYADGKIAVAINQEFVPRSQYQQRLLVDGDQIDIVKPVGGG